MNPLMIHPGGLGDVLLAATVMKTLCRHRGASQLDAICRPAYGKLLQQGGVIQSYDDWNTSKRVKSLFLHQDYAEKRCPTLCAWLGSADKALADRLSLYADEVHLIEPGLSPNYTGHVTQWWLSQLGLPPTLPEPLHLSTPSHKRIPQDKRLIIHPGSGSREKCWPWENFIEVARSWTKAGGTITWLLGPAEIDRDADLLALFRPKMSQLGPIFTEPLDRVFHLLTGASIYLGNDSGLSHLAAAAGSPTLVLFGPTSPAHWRPLGDNTSPLTAPDHHSWPLPPTVLTQLSKIG